MQVIYRNTELHSDRRAAERMLRIRLSGFRTMDTQGIPQLRMKVHTSEEALAPSQKQSLAVVLSRNETVETDGTLKFRHWLFIIYCLATFRSKEEIPALFADAFHGRVITTSAVTMAEKWMRRLDVDPEMKLTGANKKWRELWLQFSEQRKDYLGSIKDIPLAHPRKRIEALVDLFHEVQPAPDKVVTVREVIQDAETGLPKMTKGGKLVYTHKDILVLKKDFGSALQALKQIGVESGTYVEKSETVHVLQDIIRKRRQERGLVMEANVVSEEFDADSEMPEVEMPLPGPMAKAQRDEEF
jgi:hypothetical protein